MYEVSEKKNFDLVMEVFRARKNVGELRAENSIKHPMIGRTLIEVATGKRYLVEKAVRNWYWGWYVGLLIQNNNSHCLIHWENHSSNESSILSGIAHAQAMYVLEE